MDIDQLVEQEDAPLKDINQQYHSCEKPRRLAKDRAISSETMTPSRVRASTEWRLEPGFRCSAHPLQRLTRTQSVSGSWAACAVRECLDFVLILSERHLLWQLGAYVTYYNHARPHQGIDQRIPAAPTPLQPPPPDGEIVALPILNGLYHDYQRRAA